MKKLQKEKEKAAKKAAKQAAQQAQQVQEEDIAKEFYGNMKMIQSTEKPGNYFFNACRCSTMHF